MSPLTIPEGPSGLMPRRQSCDRCHEQKVRCFTNETHCSKGKNDCADAGLPQSGRYISPNPCSRCKRAKATCIYSPQQRSGRPRLPRDAASLPVRKRRVSRRSSTSTSRSATSSPSASPLIAPPASSTSGISIWNASHFYQQAFNTHISSHYTDLSGLQSTEYYASNQNFITQHNPTFSDWTSLPAHGAPYTTAESHISLPTLAADIPVSSPFILKSNASPAASLHKRRHATQDLVPEITQSWSFESPAANGYLEQLTEINIRLSQTTTAPRSTMTFPPTINDLCNTASILADLTERYNSERASIATNSISIFDFNTAPPVSSSPAINSAMDASICLMICSAHQSILGAFEDICNSFLMCLSETHNQTANMNMMGMFARPSDTISQIVSMTNLLSHLLQRLEHSVRSLDMDIDPSLSLLQTPHSAEYDQIDNISGGGLTARGEIGYSDGGAYHGYPLTSERQHIDAMAASPIFNQMEQKRNRVKAQMKTIRRWIKKSGEII